MKAIRTRWLFIFLVVLIVPGRLPFCQAVEESFLVRVASFPAPGPSPQDVAWDGESIWVVDDSTDRLYRLNLVDGAVTRVLNSTCRQPRGLTEIDGSLWVSDNYTRRIYQLDLQTGLKTIEFAAPVMLMGDNYSPLGGLAWDGKNLWSGWIAGWSSRMNRIDPLNGNCVGYFYSKGFPLGLASDGKRLWSITDNGGIRSGILYEYNLQTGIYITYYAVPCQFPKGLTFNGEYFWTIDSERNRILQLRIEQD